MIATTLNIHVDVLSKINHAGEKLGKSRREIIVILLMRMMQDTWIQNRGFSTVTYQDDDLKEKWRCFHIKFHEDENEFFVDLRKFSKFSVSCLLAMAVDRFLNEILKEGFETIDNYNRIYSYILQRVVIEDIITWHIYWGYPEEHLKTAL